MTKTPQEYEAIIEKQDKYILWLEGFVTFIENWEIPGTESVFREGRTLREEIAKSKK